MSSEGKKDKWRRQKRRRGKRQKKREGERRRRKKRTRSLSFLSALFCSLFFWAFLIIIFAFWPLKNNAKVAFAVAFCLPIVAAVVVALAGGVGEARE